MQNLSLAFILLLSANLLAIDSSYKGIVGLIKQFETGIRVGDISNKCETTETKDKQRKEKNPVGRLGEETDRLATLFQEMDRCHTLQKIVELSESERKEASKICADAKENLMVELARLRANYKNKSGVALNCTTENDNSAIAYFTKNKNDAGSDEGATAKHGCRLSYYLANGSAIHTSISSSLFTDIVGFAMVAGPNGSKLKLEQRSLERVQLDGIYEWSLNTKTKVGAGGYISRLDRGDDTFGARLQDRWHEMNGIITYTDVTPEELKGYPKYGGGIIGTIKHVIADKEYKHLAIKVNVGSRVDIGAEDKKLRLRTATEIKSNVKVYANSRNRGPYLELEGGAELETMKHATDKSTAMWLGGGVYVGTNFEGKDGGSFDFKVGATHYENLLYDGPAMEKSAVLEDRGLDNQTTMAAQKFKAVVALRYSAGTKKNKRDKQKYVFALEDAVWEYQKLYEGESNELAKIVLKRELDKLKDELERAK